MKKRMLAMCCAMLFVLGMVGVSATEASASESTRMLDGSYLTEQEEAIGYAQAMTRGEFLLNGYSKVVRLGPGEIYVGGTTMAAKVVSNVKIAVMIERVKKEGDEWEMIDGWQATNSNADRVASNRRMQVEGDYYYRVRCYHSANTDVSSSFTDGVYIEKK